jgi:hypothetical protein
MLSRQPTTEPALRTETVTNIPADEVERVRKDFEDSGALKVVIESEPDGTWTLRAIFPS